jgi:hypothetical protein
MHVDSRRLVELLDADEADRGSAERAVLLT